MDYVSFLYLLSKSSKYLQNKISNYYVIYLKLNCYIPSKSFSGDVASIYYFVLSKLVLFCQPGDSKSVTLVRIGGTQVIRGGNRIADGMVDETKITEVMKTVHERGYGVLDETSAMSDSSYIFPFNFEFG